MSAAERTAELALLVALALAPSGCLLFEEADPAPADATECASVTECGVAEACVKGRCERVDSAAGVPAEFVIDGDECADAATCLGGAALARPAFEDGAGLPPYRVCRLDARCAVGACNAKLRCQPAGPGSTPGGVACRTDDECTSGFCGRTAAPLPEYPNDALLEPGGPGVCLRVCDGVNDCPGTRGLDGDAGSYCQPAIAGGRRLRACLPPATAPTETSCRRDAECEAAAALVPGDDAPRTCRFRAVTQYRWGATARIPVPVCRPAPAAPALPVGGLCRTPEEVLHEECCRVDPTERCDGSLDPLSDECDAPLPLDAVLASCEGGWCGTAHQPDVQLQVLNDRWFDSGSGDPATARCSAPCASSGDCPDRWQCSVPPRMEDLGEWLTNGSPDDPGDDRGLSNLRCMLPIGACFDEFDCRAGLPGIEPPQRPDALGSWDLEGDAERCTFDLRGGRVLTLCVPPRPALGRPGSPCGEDAGCDTGLCLPVDPRVPDGPQSCATPCDPISESHPARDRCGLLAPGAFVERDGLPPFEGLEGFEATAGATCLLVPISRPGLRSTTVHACR